MYDVFSNIDLGKKKKSKRTSLGVFRKEVVGPHELEVRLARELLGLERLALVAQRSREHLVRAARDLLVEQEHVAVRARATRRGWAHVGCQYRAVRHVRGLKAGKGGRARNVTHNPVAPLAKLGVTATGGIRVSLFCERVLHDEETKKNLRHCDVMYNRVCNTSIIFLIRGQEKKSVLVTMIRVYLSLGESLWKETSGGCCVSVYEDCVVKGILEIFSFLSHAPVLGTLQKKKKHGYDMSS